MPDDALTLLAKDVRGKTLRLLEGVTDQEAAWTPAGLVNNIAWHAGHSFVVVEHLAISAAAGQPPVLPNGWFDLFSWKSAPGPQTQYPPLASIIEQLKSQLDRVLNVIDSTGDAALSAIVGDPVRGRSLRHSILHGFHDEAGHQGEIWLLKKLQKKMK